MCDDWRVCPNYTSLAPSRTEDPIGRPLDPVLACRALCQTRQTANTPVLSFSVSPFPPLCPFHQYRHPHFCSRRLPLLQEDGLCASYHIHLIHIALQQLTLSQPALIPFLQQTQAPLQFHPSLHGMFHLRCSAPRQYAASPSCHWVRSRVGDEPCRIIYSRWIPSLLWMRC